MRPALIKLAPYLRLTRITTAFAAVANVWFVVLWTRANPEHEPGTREIHESALWVLLLGGTVAALGLFAFGAALNDILDLKRDRTMRPGRPLASGELRPESAFVLVPAALVAAVLGATAFGTSGVLMTLLAASAILGFNALGKFIPAIGIVLLGLIYSGHMVVPNIYLSFVWPVWLVLTHALLVAGITHAVSRKVPPLSRRALVGAVLGWVFWSAVILYFGWLNSPEPALWPAWVSPSGAVLCFLLAVIFGVFVWRKIALHGRGARAGEKIGRYGALWLAMYDCAWLVGQNDIGPALYIVGLTVAGFIGMTAMREAYGLVEQPLGYRR